MTEVVRIIEPVITVAAVAQPGLPGPPGSGVTDADAFHVTLLLAELDNDTKRAAARANLGIETWDGGTF